MDCSEIGKGEWEYEYTEAKVGGLTHTLRGKAKTFVCAYNVYVPNT